MDFPVYYRLGKAVVPGLTTYKKRCYLMQYTTVYIGMDVFVNTFKTITRKVLEGVLVSDFSLEQ